MGFETEPTAYEKTAISDLQGAWENLRSAVLDSYGFAGSDKLIFHINEAMSWESVRDLKKMKATLLLVQNLIVQSESPEEVVEWVVAVRGNLEAAFDDIAQGKAK